MKRGTIGASIIITIPVMLMGCSVYMLPGEIVGLVLNHRSVEQYLHPDEPGRLPVLVSTHLVYSVPLEKYGHPVRFLSDEELIGKPHLRFTSVWAEDDGATYGAEFEYESEGMVGSMTAERQADGSWILTKIETAENNTR